MLKMLKLASVPLVAALWLAGGQAAAQSTYRFTDLGTLGGNSSYYGLLSEAGKVAGVSETSTGQTHAFFWNGGPIVDLYTLGGAESSALDINAFGQVTGVSLTLDGHRHAFSWSAGLMTDLGALSGTRSEGLAINDAGWVTGTVWTALDSTRPHPFVWDGTVMTDLDDLCTAETPCFGWGGGHDINEVGHVTGFTGVTEPPSQRAFLWDRFTMVDLGHLGGWGGSRGNAINESDQVTGMAMNVDNMWRAFRWDGSTGMVELPAPYVGTWTCEGRDINEAGDVMGYCSGNDGVQYVNRAFLWVADEMHPLNALSCDYPPCKSEGFDINDRGQVVGMSDWQYLKNQAVLWQGGLVYNLNDLIDPEDPLPSCVTLTEARSINNSGQIAVQAAGDGWECPPYGHVYLLTPLNPDAVPPVISDVSASLNPVQVGSETTLTATADDSTTGQSDVDSAEYRVDDGGYVPMTTADEDGFNSMKEDVTATLPGFAEAGVYEVCVRGTDEPGNTSDPATDPDKACTLVVAYDPSGGFVTGGGWLYSQLGACQYDVCAEAEGKANFGFVSRYKKGATIPTGNTEFQFKAGGLNFHSETYDWLVVNKNGTNAQYKGSGTINGNLGPAGEAYKFMLWARDLGNTGIDTFRIKIWYEDGGDEVVVYDNRLDQEIGGGNIVVHTK